MNQNPTSKMALFRHIGIFAVTLFSFAPIFGQVPNGSAYGIFRAGSDAGIFSINYPEEQFAKIESGAPQDLCLNDSILYFISSSAPQSDTFLYKYQLSTGQKLDSVALRATRVSIWQDHLLLLCSEAPFVRVLSPQNLQLQFVLDTSKVSTPVQEMITNGDTAYLMHAQSLQLLSLSQADTLQTLSFSYPIFPSVAYNTSIQQDEDRIFVGVDYATGAIRTALMMVDKQNLQTSLAFHKEFRGFYSPPVPFKDQVFVFTYPDHYRISQDTLIELVHVLTETVLAVDTAEELIFIYDILNRRLSVEQQSQRSTGLTLPQKPDKIIWQKASTSLSLPPALANQIKVYPNPSPSFLHVELPGSSYWQLSLYDIGGRLIAERQTQGTSRIDWALPEGLPNMILLKIEDEEGRQTSRIIKIVP